MFCSLILGAMFSIVHSTDAGVDDFATTALIAAAQERNKILEDNSFDFPAVIITNADCEPISALKGYLKTAELLNLNETKIALSASKVWTQFPWIWRLDSNAVNELAILKNHTAAPENLSSLDGNEVFVDVLKRSDQVKIIATGPLTTIADVFKTNPELAAKISELHWMGGAVDCPGNLIGSPEVPTHLFNDKAEWNVFSDPEAADWIFRNTSFAIYLYPLDISDCTIPNDFIEILKKKKSSIYSQYVADCYKIVENIVQYRMWDVAAAAGVLFPEVLEHPVKENLRVDLSDNEQGALIKDVSGREVLVYKQFKDNNPDFFYEAVATILSEAEK